MIKVILYAEDIAKAYAIANLRWNGKENFGSTRNYGKSKTSERVHQIGALGEVAVAKYYNLDIDILPRIQGDNGSDFLCHGKHFDVQTTSYNPPHLKYDVKHPFRADIAILVRRITEDSYEIAGWITSEKFEELNTTRDYGYGLRKFVTPNDLMLPEKLSEII